MIRVMLYNLYRGGEGRIPLITTIVREQKPDILCCLETVGWEQRVKTVTHEFGYMHAFFGKANTKYDMTIMSVDTPKKQKQYTELFWHTALLSVYNLPHVGEVALLLLHLNPKNQQDRVKEVEYALGLIQSFPHTIIMGDLNSLSPHDPYDRSALFRVLQKQGIRKFGTETLRFDCIERIEAAGFHDVMHVLKKPFVATVPTPANEDAQHAAPLRLDYCFISSSLIPYCTDATTLRTASTDAASDHYPLVVDFIFDKKRP